MVNRNEITKNMQWLLSLGGTIEMIEKIAECFCKRKQTVLMNQDKFTTPLNLKSTMVYMSLSNDSGHWVYYNHKGELYNSYDLDHQMYGSAQFCQTYAILYMLGHNNSYMKKKFTDKLCSGTTNYQHNIRIVVKFWRYMFKFNKLLRKWMINEIKEINNYDISKNYPCITYNTMEINTKLINNLLLYIYSNSEEIAQLC